MPDWATGPRADRYWRAAEGPDSRTNGRTAITVVFALPHGLTIEQQNTLALEMAENVAASCAQAASSSRLPITFAIHEGYGRNPHVHMIVSTSANDGIARSPTLWFKRAKPEHPESGGAARARFLTKRQWLLEVRELWADLANQALKRAEVRGHLDHRSYAARGMAMQSSIHLGPRRSHFAAPGTGGERSVPHRSSEEHHRARDDQEEVAAARRALLQIQIGDVAFSIAVGIWNLLKERSWRHLLSSHPLAGDADSIRASATLRLLEKDSNNFQNLRRAYEAIADTRQFVDVAGPSWNAMTTGAGIWAVRPGDDGVVMLGPGYVVSDGTDADAIATVLKMRGMLPFRDPVLIVREDLATEAERQVSLSGSAVAVHRVVQRDASPAAMRK